MIILPLLMSLTSCIPTDTLVVGQAQMQGPYGIQRPFETDSVNMKGKAYDVQEALQQIVEWYKQALYVRLHLSR